MSYIISQYQGGDQKKEIAYVDTLKAAKFWLEGFKCAVLQHGFTVEEINTRPSGLPAYQLLKTGLPVGPRLFIEIDRRTKINV
tara:strand:+ start:6998 stop:7246 length:249 start_codon:yes stop_codon:yes gene_type:complete